MLIGVDRVYNRAHLKQLVQTVLPPLATGLSTLVLIQPGTYRGRVRACQGENVRYAQRLDRAEGSVGAGG